MTCPRCGQSTRGDLGRCTVCGAGFAQTSVATGVLAIDTTGLPPGATFGPSEGITVGSDPEGITAGSDPEGATVGSDPDVTVGSDPEGVTVGSDPDATVAPGAALGAATAPGGPLRVGQSFGPRYHVIKLLGIGGMGAVYQAWDAELGVAVALKVIRVDTKRRSRLPEAEKRFKQELILARQVTHKNVVRIHDLGEMNGIKFITMPFVKGEDLASLLRRELKLPVSRTLRLARQIAAGLQAAHEAGVVHRDLKPANIMIGGEPGVPQALIMDFGISASSDDASEGVIIGTFEYMPPEQAAGKGVDARADIYAFGLIVYECLVGLRLAAPLETPLARIEAMKYRIAEGVVPLRVVDRTIPEALETVVMRCLERDPARRYQTTSELVGALATLDDSGKRLPMVRRLTKPMMAAAAAIVALLVGGTYYTAKRLSAPVKPHDPVSVVIADFQNSTNDPAFDHTLEPMVKRALEGAAFVSAYERNGIRSGLGVKPPEKLDEVTARELAVKQGLGVVVSGSIRPQGSGYEISVKAAQTVTGNVIATARNRAASKDQVLGTATKLVATIRKALGDKTKESDQMFAMASLSATSLDVVRFYTAAQEAASNSKFEEARQNAAKAVELDPNFGVGYQLLSAASRNLGNLQDAEKYSKEALRHLDGMTERERYSTRGLYYRLAGDWQTCVKEYGELVTRFSADVVGHNQRALCRTQLRDMRGAMDDMRPVVDLLPQRAIFRANLALYANYAGDFQTGEREARKIQQPDVPAALALAFAQLGQGQWPQATETFRTLGTINALGASFAASGLGDLAILEGRFDDGVRILEQGAGADLTSKNPDRAATKFAAAAYARILRQQKGPAIAAAEKALANSKAVKIRFLAGRVFVEAGEITRVQTLISGLGSEFQAEPQAYAKILEADVALKNGDNRQAVKLLGEANGLLDTWIGHFDLGRAYLEASALPQADSEFDRCIKRRGEALELFLDEEATSAYFPPVYYYQGRVREGLNNAGFAESYREYLNIRGKSTEDPLVPEVRRRASH